MSRVLIWKKSSDRILELIRFDDKNTSSFKRDVIAIIGKPSTVAVDNNEFVVVWYDDVKITDETIRKVFSSIDKAKEAVRLLAEKFDYIIIYERLEIFI